MVAFLPGILAVIRTKYVATDNVETPEEIVKTIEQVMEFVPKERIVCCTNCGMAPMHRDVAVAKLTALGKGAALARDKFR